MGSDFGISFFKKKKKKEKKSKKRTRTYAALKNVRILDLRLITSGTLHVVSIGIKSFIFPFLLLPIDFLLRPPTGTKVTIVSSSLL